MFCLKLTSWLIAILRDCAITDQYLKSTLNHPTNQSCLFIKRDTGGADIYL